MVRESGKEVCWHCGSESHDTGEHGKRTSEQRNELGTPRGEAGDRAGPQVSPPTPLTSEQRSCPECGFYPDKCQCQRPSDQQVALKVSSDPELFVYGSPDATKIAQDALWQRPSNPLLALLREARATIEGLVDQQAMPDDSWKPCADRIDAALRVSDVTVSASNPPCDRCQRLEALLREAHEWCVAMRHDPTYGDLDERIAAEMTANGAAAVPARPKNCQHQGRGIQCALCGAMLTYGAFGGSL